MAEVRLLSQKNSLEDADLVLEEVGQQLSELSGELDVERANKEQSCRRIAELIDETEADLAKLVKSESRQRKTRMEALLQLIESAATGLRCTRC
jgi:hypothetical protein